MRIEYDCGVRSFLQQIANNTIVDCGFNHNHNHNNMTENRANNTHEQRSRISIVFQRDSVLKVNDALLLLLSKINDF